MQEALTIAREMTDAYYRISALVGIIAPHLKPSEACAQVLEEALLATREIKNVDSRASVMSDIAPHFLLVSPNRFYSLWNAFLQMAILQTRQEMQSILVALAPVLTKRGNIQTLTEVVQALQDVARWWP